MTSKSVLNKNKEDKSERWANKTEYLLSCVGYAVGIMTIYRFPYLCYRNGGGAFLIPFIVMLFTCTIPMMFLETTLGQFSSLGCKAVFELCPIFKGVELSMMMANFIGVSITNALLSLSLLFIYNSFQETLPWSHCNNSWNTDRCIELSKFDSNSSMQINGSVITAADEFFHKNLLEISTGIEDVGGIVMQIFLVGSISMTITYFCIIKGIRTVGKVVYFSTIFPFIVLFALLVKGLTLPGAWEGITYYIYPQWDLLVDLKTWSDAANQVVLSLGPGSGVFINMASYNDFRNNNKRDAFLVPISNALTSILSGFAVFSILGYMSHQTGVPVSDVVTGRPGLAFITFPEAISMLPFPQLWGIMFFVMIFLLGIDTAFGRIEIITKYITDLKPNFKKKSSVISLLICIAAHLLSLIFMTNGGMYIWSLVEWYFGALILASMCFIEFIIVAWVYGVENFIQDAEFMLNQKLHRWWLISWKFITPIVLLFMICLLLVFSKHVTYNGIIYPDWTVAIGWVIRFSTFICIPGYALYKIVVTPGSFIERFQLNFKSTERWGPKSIEIRNKWLLYKKENNKLLT